MQKLIKIKILIYLCIILHVYPSQQKLGWHARKPLGRLKLSLIMEIMEKVGFSGHVPNF
jgi:hypothetical protein